MDVRFYAINRNGRQRLEAVTEGAAREEVRTRPYFRTVPPTKLVKETREEVPL